VRDAVTKPARSPGTGARCSRWGSHGGGEGAGEVPCGSLRSARCRANRWGTPLPHHRRQRWAVGEMRQGSQSMTRPPDGGRVPGGLEGTQWERWEGGKGADVARTGGRKSNWREAEGLGKRVWLRTGAGMGPRSQMGRKGGGQEDRWSLGEVAVGRQYQKMRRGCGPSAVGTVLAMEAVHRGRRGCGPLQWSRPSGTLAPEPRCEAPRAPWGREGPPGGWDAGGRGSAQRGTLGPCLRTAASVPRRRFSS